MRTLLMSKGMENLRPIFDSMPNRKITIDSLSSWFLVHCSSGLIKLKKGMHSMEVIAILGEPETFIRNDNSSKLKLNYKLHETCRTRRYIIIFRDDLLERVVKTN